MSRSSVSCSTTLCKALCATLLGHSHFLLCSSSGDSVGCTHFGNNVLGSLSHLWILDIWCTIDFHLSTSNCASPLHVCADHHRWLEIYWIHGRSLPQCFVLAFLCIFFVTLLAQVPHIILMVCMGVISPHQGHYTSVSVCSYSRDIDVLYHQLIKALSQSFFLHSY